MNKHNLVIKDLDLRVKQRLEKGKNEYILKKPIKENISISHFSTSNFQQKFNKNLDIKLTRYEKFYQKALENVILQEIYTYPSSDSL